jgi:cell division protein FtsN
MTPQAWDKRDMAVKEMLQHINTHRMEKLGRASMTGIALHQRTGEEWEIILANKIRQHKEEQEEMTEIDRQRKQEEIQEMQHTAEGIQNEERMHADEQHTIYEEELAERSRYQRQHSPFGEL